MRNCKLWSVFNKLHVLAISIVFCSLQANAVVNTEKTRLIFNADDNIVDLFLSNSEKQPTLVQAWIDNGDMLASPESIQTPIIITPPVFTMKPNEIRSIRLILASRTALAKDRETIYWLNIYQIPPSNETVNRVTQKMVLPLRIRMKVFVRPSGIGELQEQSVKQVDFKLQNVAGKTTLLITNPTPWHINLNQIVISGEKIDNTMLIPKSSQTITLQDSTKSYDRLDYSVINDLGTNWQYHIKL